MTPRLVSVSVTSLWCTSDTISATSVRRSSSLSGVATVVASSAK